MKNATAVAETMKKHLETVSPGLPFRLTSTHTVGDGVWQGDLGIEIVKGVPTGYTLVEKPTDADRQLVPESGQGSHHRIASLDGVKLYRPANWGREENDLRGPVVVFESPNSIVHEPGHDHPHGTVHIEEAMTIQCRYQRNLDAETRAEIRARD